MELQKPVSIISSSLSRRIGRDNGPPTEIYRYQMDGCEPKSSIDCHPSVIKIEDDDAVGDDSRDACANGAVQAAEHSTIPVREKFEKNIEGTVTATTSTVHCAKNAMNAIDCRVTKINTYDFKGKGNNENKCKDITDTFDAIADIAAKSYIGSKRRKRARNEIATNISATAITSQHSSNESMYASTSMSMATMSHPPRIVTASISNHYIPPRLISGTGFVRHNKPTKNKNYSSNLESKCPTKKNEVSDHMLNSVGLECGDDGALRLEHFDDDDENTSTHADDFDGDKPAAVKTKDEARGDENSHPSTDRPTNKKRKSPPWTLEQHRAFAVAMFEIGLKNCSPSVIMENMRKQPRYITRERTKSHLQKYRQTKERSRAEFLKEYDAFFNSTEEAKALLSRKNCNSSSSDEKDSSTSINTKNEGINRKEPIPKVVLTTALEGKKPSKLLGGKASALLSYSVLNNFSTNHGPDQLQYKAAKLMEFPVMTEEEKKSSVGASLLQVKTLIDNMTDILLKQRHGIGPLPTHKRGVGDYESDSSSCCSSEDGYSVDDEDHIETVAAGDKQLIAKPISKDQDPMATTAPVRHAGPFAVGTGGLAHPFYRGLPTAVYPPPFPAAPVAAPPIASGFPPPQYPHPPPSFYGGAPPHLQAAGAPAFGGPTGFPSYPMYYPQDPRLNPFQQAPHGQVGAYPGAPPMQPNFYPGMTGYPAYYGKTNEGAIISNVGGSNPNIDYRFPAQAASSGDVYPDHSRETSGSQRQQQRVYDQSPLHSNDGLGDRRSYDLSGDSSTDATNQRRAEKRSKRRRGRDHRNETPSSVETRDMQRKRDDEIHDFFDRLSRVPSPDKASQGSSPSPVQRSSRGQGRFKPSSSPLHSEETDAKPMRRRSRQQHGEHEGQRYEQQFQSSVQSKSYAESPAGDLFSESDASHFASPYDANLLNPPANDRRQGQGHIGQGQQHQQSKQSDINGHFCESSDYNHQQQQQNTGGGDLFQQPAQPDTFACESDRRYATPYSSPEGDSAGKYFFGE